MDKAKKHTPRWITCRQKALPFGKPIAFIPEDSV
jgi:hypothetical protein